MFVPVSGAFGRGEYERALAIAQGVRACWPSASIHFLVSREALYAAHIPYPATVLASSPTFHSAAVIDVIERWRPHVVLFDNAGRTSQLRAARRVGAGVVYVSARRRQRRKAFRLRWMRLIDEHWIAYPRFIAGPLNVLERLKLELMRRPAVRYLDVVMAAPCAASDASVLERAQVAPHSYVLVVPGGGTAHPGAGDAVERFLGAARGLADAGVDTLFVGRSAPAASDAEVAGARHLRLRQLGTVPQSELAELMRGARLIIANGGSTLLQALAYGKPCIAVPVAEDQRERVRRCVSAGVVAAAVLEAPIILKTALDLLREDALLDSLAGRAIALGLADGVRVAVHAIDALLAAKRA